MLFEWMNRKLQKGKHPKNIEKLTFKTSRDTALGAMNYFQNLQNYPNIFGWVQGFCEKQLPPWNPEKSFERSKSRSH